MQVDIGSAELVLKDVCFGPNLTIAEIRTVSEGVVLTSGQPGRLSAPGTRISMTVTEAAMNRLISGLVIDRVSDLEVATLSGSLRISGRLQMALGIRLPFELDGALETPGGDRVQLRLRSARVVGAGAPAFLMPTIQERVNTALGAATDVAQASFSLRYTDVRVEPGRVLLHGTGQIDRPVKFIPPGRGEERMLNDAKEPACATP